MALAVDSSLGTAITSTVSNTASGAFVNTAGGCIVVPVTIGNASAISNVAVTYGAVSVPNVHQVLIDTNQSYSGLFRLASGVLTGSNTLTCTWTGTTGGATATTVHAITFTGFDTSTPTFNGATNSGSGTSATCATAGATTSGNIVVGIVAAGSSLSATAETLIARANVNGLSSGGNGQSSRANGTGGVITFTETISSSDGWGLCVVEVKAAAGGGGSATLAATSLPLVGVQ